MMRCAIFALMVSLVLLLSPFAVAEDTIPTTNPLGRIEGVCFSGKEPCADQEMTLTRQCDKQPDTTYTNTDSSGHFVFENVVPGEYLVGPTRRYVETMGKASTWFQTGGYLRWVTVEPGETVTIQVGGAGRKVIGRLVTPEGCAIKLDWLGTSDRRLSTVHPMPPKELAPDEAKKWHEDFRQSEAYRRMRANYLAIIPDVRADGSFSADDVLPGTYFMYLDAGSAEVVHGGKRRVATVGHTFTVPPGEDGSVVDLGTLTAKMLDK